tara:strand:+ start:11688 stop:12653 length:966 start_codon:yes stop_codon:yes gene_type:complete
MPDYPVSTDVDNLLKSADNAAAKTSLGLGTAAEAATGDFATATQGQTADTALQPADPTLDSVTSNGATTANDVTVGNRITTGNNTATGVNAIALGGTNNSAIGGGSEVLGGDTSTASGLGSTVIGGSGFSVSGNWSISLGGINGDISGVRGALIGGYNNTLTHNDSAMIATNNLSSVATNTAHVPNLHVFNGFTMPTGAGDNYVLTSNANGVGTWESKVKIQTVSTTAGVLSFDYTAGDIVKTTLTESVTSIAITNAVEGASGMIIFETDGLATHSMTVSSPNKVLGGYQIDFDSLTVNDVITMGYYYTGTGLFLYISQIG